MQHAGLQYGQGAVGAQSPSFAADISGGNTTSSLRQFRKKDGNEKGTDLNVDSSHIARVPPHNHYPARPNDYFRYQHQYPDYNSPFKETPAQVKYSEIAETPPQPSPIQHVDNLKHKEFMDMCNIGSQTHMKPNYPDNLNRQQSYPDAASVHHQYLHKEPQVHSGYKPESQYQQYPQLAKYNMPSQCRKYPPPPPPPESDFLAKLQRINPSMARSIMSDHHIRESQNVDQNRMYSQNQRYYPPIQNGFSYNYQPYNYPSSCNYKHPEYARPNQMAMGGGTQYPALNPHSERSLSPRNLHMMNYGTSPQKISPTYPQYNAPEYAQHYQHRRASVSQEYYQQACRTNPYMGGHQVSPDPPDNRGSGGGLRHFIENWAEEEVANEVTPIFKENIRIHNESSTNEQVFVINSSDIPQCVDVSLVTTENGQYIIKSGGPLDSSVVRIRETTENNGERTVNLQIVEGTPKPDCMLEETDKPNSEEATTVPYVENQTTKDCDEETKTSQSNDEPVTTLEDPPINDVEEASVIVSNEVSVIKDMPIIEEGAKHEDVLLDPLDQIAEILPVEDLMEEETKPKEKEEIKEVLEETHITTTTKRTQRIFSVDDIIGTSQNPTRRSSLQFPLKLDDDKIEDAVNEEENEEESGENVEFRNAISIEDDSVILEIGGALVQLNINCLNGTKVLSVLPLSESLVIDVNGNYQRSEDQEKNNEEIEKVEENEETAKVEDSEELKTEDVPHDTEEIEDEIMEDVCQSEVVIGEENVDEVFLDLDIEESCVEVENEDETIEEESDDIGIEENEEHDEEEKKVEDLTVENIVNRDVQVEELKKCEEENIVDEKVEKISEDEGVEIKEEFKNNVQNVNDNKEEIKLIDDTQEEIKEPRKKEEKETEKPATKAAKKLYEPAKKFGKEAKKSEEKSKNKVDVKKSMSKLEETVNKIKTLKEKNVKNECKPKKSSPKEEKKSSKKVTFKLETEVREINKEEMDRKKLSWEEYNHRKRKTQTVNETEETKSSKIMEDTVTSTDDIDDEVVERVALSIENAIKDSKRSPPKTPSNWEDDTPSPPSPKNDPLSRRKCIIDANEFNIKPIESVSTPSPVSSSQFSYHSEDDSLQVYKDVVDSKLNSLNITIPKFSKPKPVDKISVLLDRFLNKGTLNCNELEKMKKIIEFKRKIKEKQYELKGERDFEDLKLHFRKLPEKRKKKRFRNLYAEDTSEDSDDSSEKGDVGDYSVYQRDSQGVPKLIIRRKSGLPQPFVKLERSQAVELLAKKRKLY